MIGKLYKISFIGTDKVYIGKTYQCLDTRLKDHIKNINKHPKRKLSRALNKYPYTISLIGEYPQGILEEKEIEYIKLYDSFKNGYNSTLGGDGSRYLTVSDEKVLQTFKESHTVLETAKKLSIDPKTVRTILKGKVDLPTNNGKRPWLNKPIYCAELDEVFDSAEEIATLMLNCNLHDGPLRTICLGIRNAAAGKRASYLGFHFNYEPVA